jgi:hypothetical protein
MVGAGEVPVVQPRIVGGAHHACAAAAVGELVVAGGPGHQASQVNTAASPASQVGQPSTG